MKFLLWKRIEEAEESGDRLLEHFVDETWRNHDTSSPFTNCKGAANMRGWNFAKQPLERSFCERVPAERNLRPRIQKGNLSIGAALRDALRKTRRGAGSRDPREKERGELLFPSWNRLYWSRWIQRLRGPIFSKPTIFCAQRWENSYSTYLIARSILNKMDKIAVFAIIEDHSVARCICLKGRRQENHALASSAISSCIETIPLV